MFFERGRQYAVGSAEQAGNLLCVKSIVTIVLTVVFACLALSGKITGQDFLTVFSVVIAFYFGTQSQRLNEKLTETTGEKKQTDK